MKYYAVQEHGSVSSAEIVVPLFLGLFSVASVVDFGCGVAGWLKTFSDHGVDDYLGLDGDYVSTDMLKIPSDRFKPTDLAKSVSLPRVYDAAVSLEVAEHLQESSADNFVASLVRAAPVILFSAAIPLQGGKGHFNEQWQSYWASKFAEHGYVAVDCIRPAIFRDSRVKPWYRQNILVFCTPDKVPTTFSPVTSAYELDRVDYDLIEDMYRGPVSGAEALKSLKQAAPVLMGAVLRKARLR
jgi:hypothetical protein